MALSGTLLSALVDLALWKMLATATGRQPLSPMGTGVSSPSIAAQPSVLQRSICASPPAAAVTLAAYPAAVKQVPQAVAGLAVAQEPEVTVAYYVDSPSDEEEAAVAEAEVDFAMGDLEQLFQEQLVSLAEDVAEYQATRKAKAVVMDPSPQKDHASIMVLEEDPAAAATTRLDELIALQPGVGLDGLCNACPT